MPPAIALAVWFVLLVALLCLDPARVRETSAALWIPIAWMFIAASRLPSQWLGAITGQQVVANLQDGNSLDRTVDLVLIIVAIAILVLRSFNWSAFFTRNLALTLFILFALVSVFWSDFPLVAFKRWFRDLGNYIMVFVVLSDPHPFEAVRAVFRRLGYLLVPLSIVLDKYFSTIGRTYDPWSGLAVYVGVATGKNLLGLVALLSGVFFFWDTVARWPDRKEQKAKRVILLNLAFLAMSVSLLFTANSATDKVCMVLGCLVVLAVHSGFFRRHSTLLKVLVPASFLSYVILSLGFGMSSDFASAVGKDPSLTDRTVIWKIVLGMHTNPLLGTGYDSFWMGPRLQHVWRTMPGIQEAHNGYLEMYLNLGIVGVLLIAGILIGGYRTMCKRLDPFSSFASLSLALWIVMTFFCVTEAGFRDGLIWVSFLLVAVSVMVKERVPSAAGLPHAAPLLQPSFPASGGPVRSPGAASAARLLPGSAVGSRRDFSKGRL